METLWITRYKRVLRIAKFGQVWFMIISVNVNGLQSPLGRVTAALDYVRADCRLDWQNENECEGNTGALEWNWDKDSFEVYFASSAKTDVDWLLFEPLCNIEFHPQIGTHNEWQCTKVMLYLLLWKRRFNVLFVKVNELNSWTGNRGSVSITWFELRN